MILHIRIEHLQRSAARLCVKERKNISQMPDKEIFFSRAVALINKLHAKFKQILQSRLLLSSHPPKHPELSPFVWAQRLITSRQPICEDNCAGGAKAEKSAQQAQHHCS